MHAIFPNRPWSTVLAQRQVPGTNLLLRQPTSRTIRTLASDDRQTHKSDNAKSAQRGEVTDEQIVHELNLAHVWLPDEQQAEEFGLDDVEAHLASQQGAQVRDVSKKGNRHKRGGRSSSKAISTLADVDPESVDLPSWIDELREEGFNVLGKGSELFLQRGSVVPPQQYRSRGPGAGTRSGSRGTNGIGCQQESPETPTLAQQFARGKLEEAAAAIPDSNLAVRCEFDPRAWQQQIQSVHPLNKTNAMHKDAWYTAEGGSSGTDTVSSQEPQQGIATLDQPTGYHLNVQKHLLSFNSPDRLLSYVEACFPSWSRNGCWLLHQTRLGLVSAPTPAEAAAALKGVALAAKRAGYNLVQTQGLARDRRVLGLVECLRLTHPRSPPQQPASISKRLWAIAKVYWLRAGAGGAAAQQELLTATRMAAAAESAPKAGGPGGHVSPFEPPGLKAAGPGGAVPSLGPLLAQLQSSGLTLTRQQLAAAQALIRSRQEEQLRKEAFVNAIWGMSAIGGPLFFQQEMDAICQVAAFGRWKLSSSEVSDILWALANARHWSKLLPQLEMALVAAGGVSSCTAPELITVLWSYATLAHRPMQLLEQLNMQGWTCKLTSNTPSKQGSRRAAATAASKTRDHWQVKQHQEQQQQESVCCLDKLSGGQLTSLAWSLACLQQVTSGLFKQVWVEVCRRGMALSGDSRQLVRVQQAALALQLEGDFTPFQVSSDQGAAQLLKEAARTFKAQSGALKAKMHSSYQRSIASILAKQRVMHVLEDNTTGYSVDISIPSLRVAVEADGPSHMSRNTVPGGGRVQLGATAMKRRHLNGLGWAVANISYEDWDALADEEQRTAFLKQQINSARAQLAAASHR